MSSLPDIPSPCTGVCTLDKQSGLCKGCLRSRDEIRIWGKSDNEARLAILQELKKRRMAAGRISESDLRPRRRRRG
ncbi:DUF1289 domain-containing protein [Aestuariispira insulae]|uniref:Fe-S protein YdhL (DUF1289 family) n=1 Tax=Aestuariispira insulae TaxID=1461337 RepID=A0A3D9HZ95_9PROT|nr:DUF1289 domain-containing protein [Aestuariispira insulae]RED54226.1 hypothetical protein DFP90_1011029 [Aestuariispira insulae]